MYIYKKYIGKNVALSTLLMIFIISAVICLIQSLKYIDLIVNSGINFFNLLHLIALLLPTILFLAIPITFFIGTVYSYNKLYSNSELIILSSSGMSKLDLIKPALIVASWIMIISYFISFYLLPLSNRDFKDKIKYYKENHISLLLQEGVFAHPNENITIYITSKNLDQSFEGIFINDQSSTNLSTIISAKRGMFIAKNGKTILVLSDGNRQEIDKNDHQQILYFKDLEIDLKLDPRHIEKKSHSVGEMYMNELLFSSEASTDNLITNKMRSEAHNRIIWPLLSILFAFIAVEAIIGGEHRRLGKNSRILKLSILVAIITLSMIGINNLSNKFPIAILFQYLTFFGYLSYFYRKFKS